jgi:DNA-binding PadR family transcriptional regulator
LLSQRKYVTFPVGNQHGGSIKQKTDVSQGTLALMVLKTLDATVPHYGYGIARRTEHINGGLRAVNQGTLYPVLLKLEQERAIASDWGASEKIAERASIDGREKGVSSRRSRPRIGNKRQRLSVDSSE